MSKLKEIKQALLLFIIGFSFVGLGIIMLVFDIVKVGRHYLTQQHGTIGGAIIIFVGLVVLVVGYFSLSPFTRIREFFEGKSRVKR